MTTDPLIRYAAVTIVLLTFAGALAVAIHGYYLSVSYTPPPLVVAILTSAIQGALLLLGVHQGATSVTTGVVKAVVNGSEAKAA